MQEVTNPGKDRKSYDEPKLVEWGKLTDLTHGSFSGDTDPISGASAPVFAPPPWEE